MNINQWVKTSFSILGASDGWMIAPNKTSLLLLLLLLYYDFFTSSSISHIANCSLFYHILLYISVHFATYAFFKYLVFCFVSENLGLTVDEIVMNAENTLPDLNGNYETVEECKSASNSQYIYI